MPRKNTEAIRSKRVFLIDQEGQKLGEFLTIDAEKTAQEQGLDLVRVGGDDELPVCKIMDYGKHLYEKKKRQKQTKQSASPKVKEIRFRVTTDINDLRISAKKASKFLDSGDRVKVTVSARGRELAHKNLMMERYNQFFELLGDEVGHDSMPRIQGRNLISTIVNKK